LAGPSPLARVQSGGGDPLSPNFARALEFVSAEMATDVLPALRELTVDPVMSES
jgi:hypothetical protein